MKKIVLLVLIIISIVLSGCTRKKDIIKRQTYALGTVIDFTILNENEKKANEAIDKAIKRIEDIEKKMSVNIETSQISSINKMTQRQSAKVDPDVFYVIKEGLKFGDISQGKFDITTLPLTKLWNIGTSLEKIPTQGEIDEATNKINYRQIQLNRDTQEVKINSTDMGVDLGGIAKGYIGDEVRKVLKKENIKSAIVSLGGNITLIGEKSDKSKWKVGIQNPETPRGNYIIIVETSETNIVTSGDYERFFEQDGIRYHHILDPQSGYPSNNNIASVTIISEKGIDADALSTSTYLLGLSKGMKLIRAIPSAECIIVTKDKKVYATEGIKQKFIITNDDFKLGN